MSPRTVAVVGAGASWTTAAQTQRTSDGDVEVELFTRTDERPYNRALVNQGVATGLLEPDQAALPDPVSPSPPIPCAASIPVHASSASTQEHGLAWTH